MTTNQADAPLLGYGEIAALSAELGENGGKGLTRSSLRALRASGRMPEPDDLTVPDRPRWLEATVRAWLANRPGRGYRTDKYGPPAGPVTNGEAT